MSSTGPIWVSRVSVEVIYRLVNMDDGVESGTA